MLRQILTPLVFTACCSNMYATPRPESVQIAVTDTVRHTLDRRVFGQFLERPSWGEHGPERAVNADGKLPHEIVGMLAAMDIPIVRWPGGTDIDYTDWTDLIDHAPGRSPERPTTIGHTGEAVTNRFGMDEYAELARVLDWETIVPVNLLDGAIGRQPLEAAALHAAGLVAYCNARVGAELPAGMPDWPAIRARNGHPEPFGFRYFQLGNETWIRQWRTLFNGQFDNDDTDNPARRYRETAQATIRAMKAVDPSIQIIMDFQLPADRRAILTDPYLRENIDFVALHRYAPMDLARRLDPEKMQGKEPVGLRSDDWEFAFNVMPGAHNEAGENTAFGEILDEARALGYQVAVTEWNWNGWGFDSIPDPLDFPPPHAAAVGVAGFLNGLIRRGDVIKIATQSMLIGHEWDIAAIRYDEDGLSPPYYNAQGAVTTLYNLNHGTEVLAVELEGVSLREQAYALGAFPAAGTVATVDAVATRKPGVAYLHLVNRDPAEAARLDIDLRALQPVGPGATLRRLRGVPEHEVATKGGWMETIESTLAWQPTPGLLRLRLPPSTVAVLELPIAL